MAFVFIIQKDSAKGVLPKFDKENFVKITGKQMQWRPVFGKVTGRNSLFYNKVHKCNETGKNKLRKF